MIDLQPQAEDQREEILHGLKARRKRLHPKFLYDGHGSALFEAICELPEYYITRTEHAILESNLSSIAGELSEEVALIEFGSGSSAKTTLLLDGIPAIRTYVPIDISKSALNDARSRLSARFPALPILPVCADYCSEMAWARIHALVNDEKLVFFPGSTIGNFHPQEAEQFLTRVAQLLGRGGQFLIGVDLLKSPARIQPAYDDSAGVTARFNLNLLSRLNRELGASFDLRNFVHQAFFNSDLKRVEMHLVSRCEQLIRVGQEIIHFEEGESIHTECSYKYTHESFIQMANSAGFQEKASWKDPDGYFCVFLLQSCESRGGLSDAAIQ